MSNNKLIRKTFLVEESMLEKMELMQAHLSLVTLTDVFRNAINLMYNNSLGDYKYRPDPLLSSSRLEEIAMRKAEIKVKAKQAGKDAVVDSKYEGKTEICEDILGGRVEEKANGDRVCVFTQYSISGDKEEILPLKQVTADMENTHMYIPSKKAVLKNRPELNK